LLLFRNRLFADAYNIVVVTTISAPVSAQSETREALLAYVDALTLAEPIQARLWQLAHLTLTQVSVLRELKAGSQTAGMLGQAVGLSPTSVTRLVDRLERRRLVTRHRESEDRRCVEIRLSAAGERLLGEVKILRGSHLHRAVESMAPDERRRLTVGLRRLVRLARSIAAQNEEGG